MRITCALLSIMLTAACALSIDKRQNVSPTCKKATLTWRSAVWPTVVGVLCRGSSIAERYSEIPVSDCYSLETVRPRAGQSCADTCKCYPLFEETISDTIECDSFPDSCLIGSCLAGSKMRKLGLGGGRLFGTQMPARYPVCTQCICTAVQWVLVSRPGRPKVVS